MYTGADTGLSVGCISADKVRGEGEAFSAGLPDQRPAGERAGYQGKNNTHTIQSSRHQRATERDEEIVGGGEGGRWSRELGERRMESDRGRERRWVKRGAGSRS